MPTNIKETILTNKIDLQHKSGDLQLKNFRQASSTDLIALEPTNDGFFTLSKYDLSPTLANIADNTATIITNQQNTLTNATDIWTINNNNPGLTFSNDSTITPVGTNRLEYHTINSNKFSFDNTTKFINLGYNNTDTFLTVDNVNISKINDLPISSYLNPKLQSGTFSIPEISTSSLCYVNVPPINYIRIGSMLFFNGVFEINEVITNTVDANITTHLINGWPDISDNNFHIHHTVVNQTTDKIVDLNSVKITKNTSYNSVKFLTKINFAYSHLRIFFSGSYQTWN